MAGTNVQTVQAEHKAFMARDWAAIRDLIVADCIFVDGTGTAHKGPEAFVNDYARSWTDAFSNAAVTEATYYDAADTVVTEFVGTGVNDGPLAGMPASHRPLSLPFCEIYHFGPDGKVTGGSAYFDMYSMLVQLGHAQPPA